MSSTSRSRDQDNNNSGKHFDISGTSAPRGWEQYEESSTTASSTDSVSGCVDLDLKPSKKGASTPAEDILSAATWKRLVQSQPTSDLGFAESKFTSIPDEQIQAWAKEYFRRKNKNVKFDSACQVILSNFMGNFYGLATSMLDFFVDNAISECSNRNSKVVEMQDFAFVEFALQAEKVNPASAYLQYKVRHLSKDGFMCPSCGKVPPSATYGAPNSMAPSKPSLGKRSTMTKAHAVPPSGRPVKRQKTTHSTAQEITSGVSSSPSNHNGSTQMMSRKASVGPSALCSDITNEIRQGSSRLDASQTQDHHFL